MDFSDYEGMWPKDGIYAETSRAGIGRDLYNAGKITLDQLIEYLDREALDITKAFEGALLMADMDEAYRHVRKAEATMLPDGSVGVGVQVCQHFRLSSLNDEEQAFWQLATFAALKAHGFEIRERDGQIQVRMPSPHGEDIPPWVNMGTDAVVSTFVDEIDKELGPSYDPTDPMARWTKKGGRHGPDRQ